MNVPADVLDLVQDTVLIVQLNVKLVEMGDVLAVPEPVMVLACLDVYTLGKEI